MPTTEELVNKYLITDADRNNQPHYPSVTTWDNTWITPLIDGDSYFSDLKRTIDGLSGAVADQRIYLSNWLLEHDFNFAFPLARDTPSGGTVPPPVPLIETLRAKAEAGADVRLLIWVNDFALSTRAGRPLPLTTADIAQLLPELPQLNVQLTNLNSIRMLRLIPELRDQVIANTLDPPLGSAHAKMAVVCDSAKGVGYTGGIDFSSGRFSKSLHHSGGNPWHDVMAKIEGPAVQALFDFFQSLWNELAERSANQLTSPRFLVGSESVPAATQPATLIASNITVASDADTSLMRVQSLRTLPNQSNPFEPSLSFASQGVYEIQLALKKAIQNAETYIYVEDQAFESREIYGYLKAAIQAKPNLKVILLTGKPDPANSTDSLSTGNMDRVLKQYLTDHLNVDQLKQLVVFGHSAATVHSKLWLIDDYFALIGSANFNNRSLFTDIEHAVSFIHSGAINQVKELRVNLWGEHFGLPEGSIEREVDLHDLDLALMIWNPGWLPPDGRLIVPPLVLPHYADIAEEFLGFEDGTLHYQFVHPVIDDQGNLIRFPENGQELTKSRLPDGQVGFHRPDGSLYRTEARPANTITAAGEDFIEDLTLPEETANSTTRGLIGFWIGIPRGTGPNGGTFRKITGHFGHRILFEPMDNANPLDVEFLLMRSVLEGHPLPPSPRVGTFLSPLYSTFIDPGELP